MRATFLAVVAALLLLVSLVTACSQNNGPDEPATVAQKFADALNNDEKQTQDKLKNKKQKGAKMHIEKEW